MSKIRNWEKIKERKNPSTGSTSTKATATVAMWAHKSDRRGKRVRVRAIVRRGKSNKYQVQVPGKTRGTFRTIGTTKNRNDAKDRAVRWMRNHPRG